MLKKLQENVAIEAFGMTKREAIQSGICVDCKQPAIENCYSEAGYKEFYISGICEKCFDKIFDND